MLTLSKHSPMRAAALILSVAATVASGSCGGAARKPASSYSDEAKRAFDLAMVDFEDHDWLEAQALFQDVKKKYPYSRYALLAELRIADADIEQEKFLEGIRKYRAFVHDHRSDSADVAYARSRIADAEYKQVSESSILPSHIERDQAPVLDAYRELRAYLTDYGNSDGAPRVRTLLVELMGRLVKHELSVAAFYQQKERPKAAEMRVQYALDHYATVRIPVSPESTTLMQLITPEQADAYMLLSEVHARMGQFTLAAADLERLLAEHPAAPIVDQARRFRVYVLQRAEAAPLAAKPAAQAVSLPR